MFFYNDFLNRLNNFLIKSRHASFNSHLLYLILYNLTHYLVLGFFWLFFHGLQFLLFFIFWIFKFFTKAEFLIKLLQLYFLFFLDLFNINLLWLYIIHRNLILYTKTKFIWFTNIYIIEFRKVRCCTLILNEWKILIILKIGSLI